MPEEHSNRMPCFFDGACPGNQFERKEPMRAAYVIEDRGFVRDVPDLVTPKGPVRSNNIAEYYGLIYLLRHLSDLETRSERKATYLICGDSQLVIRQITGRYQVRTEHLVKLNAEARRLAQGLVVAFKEVPRSQNKAGFLLEKKHKPTSAEPRLS